MAEQSSSISTASDADHSGEHEHSALKADPECTTAEPQSPVNASWQQEPLSAPLKEKVARILAACRDRDLHALATLAISKGGLVEDEVRRTACMNQPPLSLLHGRITETEVQ